MQETKIKSGNIQSWQKQWQIPLKQAPINIKLAEEQQSLPLWSCPKCKSVNGKFAKKKMACI